MHPNDLVWQIMTKDLATVSVSNRLSEVRALVRQRKVHHIPVVEGRKFIGLLTANDLLRVSWGDPYSHDSRGIDVLLDTQEIREVMQEDVKTILPGARVREAAQALAVGGFHSLPVVDEHGDLVGIVTSTDLIRYLLDQY